MRFFVTGTDTGVGKTEVSCALLSLMRARGERPFAWKPCETGGDSDSRRLRAAAGDWQDQDDVCTYRFKQPLAPAIAAKLERRSVNWSKLLRTYARFEGNGVVEGAGGLHVPFTAQHEVIDLIAALKLPVVLVARAGLGTLNHTTLSMNALVARKVKVAAIVLSRSTSGDDPSIPFNAPELARRFPKTRVIGPIASITVASKRTRAFETALRELVDRQ